MEEASQIQDKSNATPADTPPVTPSATPPVPTQTPSGSAEQSPASVGGSESQEPPGQQHQAELSQETSDEAGKEGSHSPAASLSRVATGIEGLDKEIQGGFLSKSVNLVAGSPGAGKSIFAMQFLYHGAMNGDPGIYVSFEEGKEAVYAYMKQFGWDLQKLEDEGKFVFLRYSPEQVGKLLEEGGGSIDTYVRQIKAKRIVIDSITAFMLLHRDELSRREAALALFDIIGRWGCTTLLTGEQGADPNQHEYSVVEFEVDGVILLYNQRKKNIRERVAEVLKMRGTKFDPKIIPMKITSKGVELYPGEAVY